MSDKHRELRCTNKACTYDMNEDRETRNAVRNYLQQLAADVHNERVRHVSVSVHRVVAKKEGNLIAVLQDDQTT